ncbi:hypothetical protein FPQ18DRAFT_406377 [Pyronema domesticum]|nr:hypothetical protein FPQ18DRAFT_406377 [Pyronema domesticum]
MHSKRNSLLQALYRFLPCDSSSSHQSQPQPSQAPPIIPIAQYKTPLPFNPYGAPKWVGCGDPRISLKPTIRVERMTEDELFQFCRMRQIPCSVADTKDILEVRAHEWLNAKFGGQRQSVDSIKKRRRRTKDSRESRGSRDSGDSRGSRGLRESRDSRDSRGLRGPRETRQSRQVKELAI